MSLAVWLGDDRKCSAAVCRFGFVVRVIYSTAVFIKSVFLTETLSVRPGKLF